MKQAIGAIITLSVLLLFSSLAVMGVSSEARKTINLTEQALHATEQQSAVNAVSEAKKHWEAQEWFMGSVLRHEDMEDVVQYFDILKVYALRKDWDDYYGNCAALLARLKHISEAELPRLKNIL